MKIALRPGYSPVNIEGFDDEVERSCKGALHLMANTFRDVSASELAWIKAQRPDVYEHLLIDNTAPAPPAPKAEKPEDKKPDETKKGTDATSAAASSASAKPKG